MTTLARGNQGEDIAVELLQKKGYQIIARKFRSGRGEIDIVAIHKRTLVFVEVKTRLSREFGLPEEAVTPYKLSRITRAGMYYKALNPHTPELMRIDVVAIEASCGKITRIELIENVSS